MSACAVSLKDTLSQATLKAIFHDAPPAVILNCTAFAVASPHQGDADTANPLAANDAPVFQVIFSGGTEAAWADSLKKSGLKEFHVWTIDEPTDAEFFRSMGVIGITTNRPALIRSALTQ